MLILVDFGSRSRQITKIGTHETLTFGFGRRPITSDALYIKNYYLLVSSDVLLVLEATSVPRMEAVRGTILLTALSFFLVTTFLFTNFVIFVSTETINVLQFLGKVS